MREQPEQRLAQLRSEYEAGEQLLADLELGQRNLRETMLRISGAIQVRGEKLGNVDGAGDCSALGAA